MWLLVLVLQLLKAPIASSSSCRYKGHKEVISVQGGYNCKQTRVKLGMCVGTCKSYAIPVPAEDDGNDPRFQTVCECCAPKEVRQKPVRFGDGCEQSIVVSQIRSCECKNCSGLTWSCWSLKTRQKFSFMHISSLSGDDVQMYNGAILTTAPIIMQGFSNHKIEAMVKL